MNYVDELKRDISKIKQKTLAGLPYEERRGLIEVAAEKYVLQHADFNDKRRHKEERLAEAEGRKPKEFPFNPYNAELLEELVDLILYEDLSDNSSNKASKYEYPFLSAYQLARRKEGVHEAKGVVQKGEVPLKAALHYGLDMCDHRMPTRRKRSTYEDLYVDKAAKIRNEERRAKYNEFIKPGVVITYKRSELND